MVQANTIGWCPFTWDWLEKGGGGGSIVANSLQMCLIGDWVTFIKDTLPASS